VQVKVLIGLAGLPQRRAAWRLTCTLVLAACTVVPTVYAQTARSAAREVTAPAVSGPGWASLSASQRSVLRPLEADWNQMEPVRKTKWIEIANRFPRLPPEEQLRIQERMATWMKLSPAERGRVRQNFKDAQQVSPQDRKARWEAYNALPPDRRQALADRSARPAASKSERQRESAIDQGPGKSSIVPNSSYAGQARPVAPTMSQAQPGATTNLMSKRPSPPAHQQAGMPKITATPGFVDKTTLLPQRGPQGAAVRADAGSPLAPRP
jgi:hypothetical protein